LVGAVVPGLVAVGSSADAADVSLYRPYVAAVPVLTWTGFYIGGHLGGVDNKYDLSATAVPSATAVLNGSTFDTINLTNFDKEPNRATSFMGGGQIGYNLQFGQFVLGIEGDYSAMHNRQRLTPSNARITAGGAAVAALNATFDLKSEWQASVRARGGVALGSWFLYTTGGAAFTDISLQSGTAVSTTSATTRATVSVGTGTDASSSKSYSGYTIGVGGEYAFSEFVSFGVEYRYSDFGRASFTTAIIDLRPTVSNATFNTTASVDLTSQQITARLNIRFGSLFGPQ
jgi:outer membrane immunogenic protein